MVEFDNDLFLTFIFEISAVCKFTKASEKFCFLDLSEDFGLLTRGTTDSCVDFVHLKAFLLDCLYHFEMVAIAGLEALIK